MYLKLQNDFVKKLCQRTMSSDVTVVNVISLQIVQTVCRKSGSSRFPVCLWHSKYRSVVQMEDRRQCFQQVSSAIHYQ